MSIRLKHFYVLGVLQRCKQPENEFVLDFKNNLITEKSYLNLNLCSKKKEVFLKNSN